MRGGSRPDEPSWRGAGVTAEPERAFRAIPRSRWQAAAPEEDTVFTGIVEELGEVVGLERMAARPG